MKKTILLLFFALTLGCNKYPPITEEMVIEKVYDLFRAIESENEDRSKFFDVVTDDFLIYEIGQEINKDDFLEFVESFNVVEDDWELSDFKVSLDYNSAHVYFKNKGRFIVDTPDGKALLNYSWLESAYLVRDGDNLKIKLKNFIKGRQFFPACDFCDGRPYDPSSSIGYDGRGMIEGGEQVSKPIPYKIYS